ncbi:MAG: hypothetical protein K2P92_03185, partial [Bdellovibrionaceae bacterium]|nr:hypothetical protein [Pseudobdellovibrionaceae bacterium]
MTNLEAQKKIQNLLSLVDHNKSSKQKIDILNQIETLNGYDLVFLLSLITRNHFSGQLIIVNEEDLLSSITFIYGDIVKVDYHDNENLLGHLIVEHEIISKFEMQEIVEKTGGKRLGDYLVENGHLTQMQLRKLLFKQTTARLGKYLNSLSIRIKFSFDGQSHDSILINKIDYADILYKWIFENYQEEWLEEYAAYYQKSEFSSELETEKLTGLKDFSEVYQLANDVSLFKKTTLSYNELFKMARKTRSGLLKSVHFLVLIGALSIIRNKEQELAEAAEEKQHERLTLTINDDLADVQDKLLNKKYFEAFGVLNKYSSLMKSNVTVSFYFIWIKLIGGFYHKHLIDIKKITQDFNDLDYFKINPAEFYYVRSLIYAVQKQYEESDRDFKRAV